MNSYNCYYEKIGNETKNISDEIPFEIPDNWCWVRMPSIGISKGGLTYDPKDICDEGTPVLRSPNISNGKIVLNEVVKVKTHVRENQYLELNDILICARNGSKALVGKCAIFNLESTEKFSFGAFMMAFQTPFYDYLYYYLNSNLFRSLLNKDDTKQINQVTLSTLRKTLVPLPPFKEQLKINDLLIKVLNSVDIIRISKEDINEITSVVKKKILEDVFSNNSSYKSYYEKKVPITDDAEILDYLRKPINTTERLERLSNATKTYPYYGATGQTGLIDDYLIDGEYVLLGEDGAPFLDKNSPKAYLINGKAWVNNHVHILKSKTNNKFLMYYLNWFNYYDYVTGTTRLKLNQKMLKKILIPDFSVESKEKIVSQISEAFYILESII